MRHKILLRGCAVEPMAGYLKSLAVFRLVSEQADPAARGWWERNTFCLESLFDEAGLVRFFLDTYNPTPIVAPWNGGSGFGEGDRRAGIDAIMASNSLRLSEYRLAIQEIFSWPEVESAEMKLSLILGEVEAAAARLKPGAARSDLTQLIEDFEAALAASGKDRESLLPLTTAQIEKTAKPVLKCVKKLLTAAKKSRRKGGKEEIVRACRNRLGDGAVDWLDSAVVLRTSSSLMYPPILGTGGTEGRLDYTNSFMERVATLLLKDQIQSESLLRNALFSDASDQLSFAAVGQLDPGRAGGYNQGPEIETKDFPTNHWNFVLGMEGAVAWVSGAARRQGVITHGVFCSPFTVRSRAVGYGSAKDKDEDASRAEVWMPIWYRPSRFEEVRTLLREGRAEWAGKPVNNAMEFAEAAASLGTERGIAAFQRYSMIKRRGDSYIALPLGRFPVHEQPDVDLLQELDRLLDCIDSFARRFKSEKPAQFGSRRRQIDSAIYDFVLRGSADSFQNILIALGRMEEYFAMRDLRLDPKLDSPLGGLSPRWLLAANDGSLDFRIAVALASIGRSGDVGGIRANLAPIDPVKPWAWVTGAGTMAWRGNSLADRLTCVLKRRLIDAELLNCDSLPLWASIRVSPEDAAAFLTHIDIDEARIEDLLFGLTLIDWHDNQALEEVRPELFRTWREKQARGVVSRAYALLKHLFHPGLDIRPEPSILSLLSANRTSDACEIARRRLRAAGKAPVNVDFPDEQDGVRLAAALLIPIHSIEGLSRLVLGEQQDGVAVQTKGR